MENGADGCTLERHDAVRTPEVHQPKEQTRHAAAKGLGKGRIFFSLLLFAVSIEMDRPCLALL